MSADSLQFNPNYIHNYLNVVNNIKLHFKFEKLILIDKQFLTLIYQFADNFWEKLMGRIFRGVKCRVDSLPSFLNIIVVILFIWGYSIAYSIVEYRKGYRLILHASPSVGRHHNNFPHHSPHSKDLNDKLYNSLQKTLCLGSNYVKKYVKM